MDFAYSALTNDEFDSNLNIAQDMINSFEITADEKHMESDETILENELFSDRCSTWYQNLGI